MNRLAIGVPADLEVAREVLNCGRRIARRLGVEWTAVIIASRILEAPRPFDVVIVR